eukprot:TRINITY_DN9052_c0_g1_i1.p1 TRINITY_DN9052_c0_g1~~TRINITY_DN9052_c0_g1_i1.p1  ORF type:complete len:312 (+),score=34.35 TRINITY_DN9052_c0_g1_i1:75-1010(+)
MLCVFYHILYRCLVFFFFLMIRRPPRSTQGVSSAASDVYKRQVLTTRQYDCNRLLNTFKLILSPDFPKQKGPLNVLWDCTMNGMQIARLCLLLLPRSILKNFIKGSRHMKHRNSRTQNNYLKKTTNQGAPQICKKSSKIAQTLTDFYQRNEQSILKQENKFLLSTKDESFYTFSPSILVKSKQKEGKDYEQMSYGPGLQREIHLTYQKRILSEKESKHCTFSPQINKGKTYSGVQSRLQLANNLDTYIDRIQIQQYQKEQQALVKRQTREIGELIECTHKPQFSQIPYYMKVKQEAEAISAMKSRSISHEV